MYVLTSLLNYWWGRVMEKEFLANEAHLNFGTIRRFVSCAVSKS